LEKAEVAGKGSEDTQKVITEEATPPASPSSSDQIQESLRVLSEETLQLSEFLWQEEKLIKELCVLLKLVLNQLNLSFNIPLNVLQQTDKIQRAILNDEAHLILINDQNEVKSKALEDYPPQVIFNLVSFVIPELTKSFTSYRKKISVRISLFDKINQELRNIRNVFAGSSKKAEEGSPVNDGVKNALQAQKNESVGEQGSKGST